MRDGHHDSRSLDGPKDAVSTIGACSRTGSALAVALPVALPVAAPFSSLLSEWQ
jgi:hypothetical protein